MGRTCSACCLYVDFEKASFASLAELELFPLYPCDTWPPEWLHTAHCTVNTSETLHSAECTVQVHTSANIKGISSFEAEELRTQILCMSSQ